MPTIHQPCKLNRCSIIVVNSSGVGNNAIRQSMTSPMKQIVIVAGYAASVSAVRNLACLETVGI